MARATGGLGGKKRMQRTDTVSIRLDPRLNYLCELAARSQRRSKSSFIEAAIADKIDQMPIQNWRDEDSSRSLGDRADYLWHVRESERLISLGLAASHLMTFEEQEIWAIIAETGDFWRGWWQDEGSHRVWRWRCEEASIDRTSVAEHWDTICKVAAGESERSALPTTPNRVMREPQPAPADLDDDDIPF